MGMDLLEMNLAKLSVERHLVDLVFMPVLSAMALLGNLPTFYIFRYRSPSSVFSFNIQYLSFIYMIAIIIKLQFAVTILINTEDGKFGRACSLFYYVDMVTFVATGLQLLLTAVDRWRRIVHPEWELLNIRTVRTLSLMFMVTSLVLNVPALMVFGRRLFFYKTTVESVTTIGLWQCFIRDRDNERRLLLLYVTFITTCYMIFACCYIALYRAIMREFAVGVQHQRGAHTSSLVLRRSAQLFEAMAVTFLVCYVVYFLGLALRAAHTSDPFLFIVVKPIIDVLCYFNLMYLSSPPFIFFAASKRCEMYTERGWLICIWGKKISTRILEVPNMYADLQTKTVEEGSGLLPDESKDERSSPKVVTLVYGTIIYNFTDTFPDVNKVRMRSTTDLVLMRIDNYSQHMRITAVFELDAGTVMGADCPVTRAAGGLK